MLGRLNSTERHVGAEGLGTFGRITNESQRALGQSCNVLIFVLECSFHSNINDDTELYNLVSKGFDNHMS